MQFKTPRVKNDFGVLIDKNLPLKRILVSLDNFCVAELGKELDLTSIYRSPEENAALGAATEVHTLWHAADASIKEFSDAERSRILGFCALWTYRGTKGKPVALIHSVAGGAEHLHLQYF